MSSLEDKGLVPPGAIPAGTPESAPTPPSAILDKAADLISKPGAWTQGTLSRSEDQTPVSDVEDGACFCLIGATLLVAPQRLTALLAQGYLLKVLPHADAGQALNPMAHFNDAKGRTQDEVVAKLREAAALAREQGQ